MLAASVAAPGKQWLQGARMAKPCALDPPIQVGFPGGRAVKDPPANAGHGFNPESGRFLEKEMVTHSSILAWRLPWTEEPGELQYMGSQRVGHD